MGREHFGINLRDFTTDEIAELNRYLTFQIPSTTLSQLFLLSEEPVNKMRVFVASYRIVYSAYNYVEDPKTREKVGKVLEVVDDAYKKCYNLVMKYDNHKINYNKHLLKEQISLTIEEYNEKINFFTDCFLIFAEKQELISTDTVSGLDLGTVEGQELYSKVIKNTE